MLKGTHKRELIISGWSWNRSLRTPLCKRRSEAQPPGIPLRELVALYLRKLLSAKHEKVRRKGIAHTLRTRVLAIIKWNYNTVGLGQLEAEGIGKKKFELSINSELVKKITGKKKIKFKTLYSKRFQYIYKKIFTWGIIIFINFFFNFSIFHIIK